GIAGRTVGTKAAIVETAIKSCLRRGVPLSVIRFDLVKGYDLLTKAGIADSVDAIGWGDDYKEFLLSMQSEYEACVRTPYGLTSFFLFLNGVKQGDPLSPDIYVDWMEMLYRWVQANKVCIKLELPPHIPPSPIVGRHVQIGPQGWIDDFGILTKATETSRGFSLVCEFVLTYNAKVSTKTIALAIGWSPTEKLKIGDEEIEWTAEGEPARVLGYHFSTAGNWDAHIALVEAEFDRRIQEVEEARTSIDGKANLINSDVLGYVTFSADLVPIPKRLASKMQQACKRAFLRHSTSTTISHTLVTKGERSKRGITDLRRVCQARIMGGLKKVLSGEDRTAYRAAILDLWEAQQTITGKDPILFPSHKAHAPEWSEFPAYITAARKAMADGHLKVWSPKPLGRKSSLLDACESMGVRVPLQLTNELAHISPHDLDIGRCDHRFVSPSLINMSSQLVTMGFSQKEAIALRLPIIEALEAASQNPLALGSKPMKRTLKEALGPKWRASTQLTFASDGSFYPKNPERGSGGAVVSDGGPIAAFQILKGKGIEVGELMAIAVAIAVAPKNGDVTIYSDSLSCLKMVDRARSNKFSKSTYAKTTYPGLVETVLALVESRRGPTTLVHVKAHTGSTEAASRLNQMADEAAKGFWTNECSLRLPYAFPGTNPATGHRYSRTPFLLGDCTGPLHGSWYQHALRASNRGLTSAPKALTTMSVTEFSVNSDMFCPTTSWPFLRTKHQRTGEYLFWLKAMSLSLPTARQLALRHPRVYGCQDCPRCERDFEDVPHALYECRWVQKANTEIENLARRTLHLESEKLYWPYVLHPARIKHKGLMVGFLTGGIPSWIAARLETLYNKKWKSVGSKLSSEILKIQHASWKKRCKICYWCGRCPKWTWTSKNIINSN
ncbi:MAG: hypothetical protein LW878_01195, partial [Proteobacteria bacterium]|nr:hypothetical protein [Pseudomonadota bacterium]